MPALADLAQQSYDANNTYADVVHFLQIYIIEPHPQSPDISPYTGDVWEAAYSTKPMPFTYAERLASAEDMRSLVVNGQTLLIDDLDNDGLINPVWCTYGPCPNCAFLIRQDGTVVESHTWVDPDLMRVAIDNLVGP